MRELPILFSTPMVQAILENRKTMTRRTQGLEKVNECPDQWICIDTPQDSFNYSHHFQNKNDKKRYLVKSSYAVGDQLYVREKFETDTDGTVKFYAGNIEVENNTAYRELTKWKPSIHMPKEAARVWLECTGVRCEQIPDITTEDAIAEGILSKVHEHGFDTVYKYYSENAENWWTKSPRESFSSLWQSINGDESWISEPWVFVYEFKRIDKEQFIFTPIDNNTNIELVDEAK